jgi:hypothetical protein
MEEAAVAVLIGGCGSRDSWHQRGSSRRRFVALERKRRTRGERDAAPHTGRGMGAFGDWQNRAPSCCGRLHYVLN